MTETKEDVIECCYCFYLHTISQREIIKDEIWEISLCPKCGREGYVIVNPKDKK